MPMSPQNSPNPGPGAPGMVQIHHMGQFKLKMAQIQAQNPLNGPNPGPEPPEMAQIQAQEFPNTVPDPQNGPIVA